MSDHLMLTLYATCLTLGLALLAGFLLGHPWPGLAVGALLNLGWQWLHIYRLDYWLLGEGAEKAASPPWTPSYFWRAIDQHYDRLLNNISKNKNKLNRTLLNFQEGVNAIPDAIVILNASDRLLWFNPAAQTLLGLDVQRDRGRKIIDLIHSPDFLAYMACWPEQKSVAFDAPDDPNRKLSGRLLPYTKKQRMLWVSDITQAHRVEQIRRDFVSSASHELRTPLTVIVGYLEILRDHADTQDTIWEGPLNAMQQQSDRMMLILRELLLLSRLEDSDTAKRYEPVNVPHMLQRIVADAYSLSGERNHTILLHAQPDLWLNGDENELHSAFSNLVFNAVQHTPPGSHIELSWYNNAKGAHLSVADNGEGIPEQYLPRLSERFYRLDKSRQRDHGSGTGLGLAIVKHVLQRHQGELHISSEIGVGSCFRCDFPPSLLAAPRQAIDATATPELEASH